jgi:hypothetical protein
MDRLREVNVRTLLNTRIDLNSLRAPPFSPYTCGTPTVKCAEHSGSVPNILDTRPVRESMPHPSPRFSTHSFVFPSAPVVQPEDFCATIRTMDGREINADLIVRSLWVLVDR